MRRSWWSRRIAVRVYVLNLVFFAVLALGLGLLFDSARSKGHPGYLVAEFASRQALRARDPSTREAVQREIPATLFPWYGVYDAEGRLVLSRQAPDTPNVPDRFRGQRDDVPAELEHSFVVSIRNGDEVIGHAIFAGPPYPRLPWTVHIYATSLILIGCALASLWFARQLTRPLNKLAETAEAFGSGQLDARVRMNRADEFGRVGATFDAMADRVCRFLDTQKELLANVSHELRTPIARLQVALDLAAEGDPSAFASFLDGMRGDLEEMDRLLRDILTVARLDIGSSTQLTGAPSIDFSTVDFSELIEGAVRRFRLVHERRQVILDVQESLPRIQADEVLLHRVVANLLDNANKYSPIERPITVRVRHSEGRISVSIRDRGSGIISTDAQHLFVPFFRVDRSRNRKTGGFGLGLALAKRIIEAHGGSIEIQSRLNLGTTVTFTIPVFRPLAEV